MGSMKMLSVSASETREYLREEGTQVRGLSQQLKGRRSFHMRNLGLLLVPSGKQCERKGT